MDYSDRCFLFLQGPHGAFFSQLAAQLEKAGCRTLKVGFNGGDEGEWPDRRTYRAFRGAFDIWPAFFERFVKEQGVTDLVVYGDHRQVHSVAVEIARKAGLRLHFFEEGYLRPHWVTYDRGGVNGNSSLMDLDLAQISKVVDDNLQEMPPAPAKWGTLLRHILAGLRYHRRLLFHSSRYPGYRSHRVTPVLTELFRYLRRVLLFPLHGVQRRLREHRLSRSGAPYHLALLQLSHDASVLGHSRFSEMSEFMDEVAQQFAAGAPRHHVLVFKAHPLESQPEKLEKTARRIAGEYGLGGRVAFIKGGKLANLLDRANSAVTINSTAGQQVLWRGIPLKIFGRAVYGWPEFVSSQPTEDFFARPLPPDSHAYRIYRRFLLATSQIPGSFYSSGGRASILRHVGDMMLDDLGPYEAVLTGAHSQHLPVESTDKPAQTTLQAV